MLKNISWAYYWSAIGFLLAIYYGVVLFKLFGHKIARKIKPLPNGTIEMSKINPPVGNPSSIAEEVVAYFDQATYQKPVKEEILFAIQKIISKNIRKIEEGEKMAIESLIQLECQEKCSVNLSDEELGFVWLA